MTDDFSGFQILIELLKIFIPIFGVVVSAAVALFAVHRADQRERDKLKRDELLQAAADFSNLAAQQDTGLVAFLNEYPYARADTKADIIKFLYNKHSELDLAMENLRDRLRICGHTALADCAGEHWNQAHELRETTVDEETAKMGSIDEILKKRRILREKRRICLDSFKSELERLRTAGHRSLIRRFFDRMDWL